MVEAAVEKSSIDLENSLPKPIAKAIALLKVFYMPSSFHVPSPRPTLVFAS
jgi:hypothetical protein